ncbi:hypothetical protein ACLOJK_024557 [Asimina triloba]
MAKLSAQHRHSSVPNLLPDLWRGARSFDRDRSSSRSSSQPLRRPCPSVKAMAVLLKLLPSFYLKDSGIGSAAKEAARASSMTKRQRSKASAAQTTTAVVEILKEMTSHLGWRWKDWVTVEAQVMEEWMVKAAEERHQTRMVRAKAKIREKKQDLGVESDDAVSVGERHQARDRARPEKTISWDSLLT